MEHRAFDQFYDTHNEQRTTSRTTSRNNSGTQLDSQSSSSSSRGVLINSRTVRDVDVNVGDVRRSADRLPAARDNGLGKFEPATRKPNDLRSNGPHLKASNSSNRIALNSNPRLSSDSSNLNDSAHCPSFAEALSNFQNIILEAERELSNSSLKQSDSIKSFELKLGIPRLNSKVVRRKSVNVKCTSKSRPYQEGERRSSNQNQRQSADSDDEKSKKKVLSSSILEKRNKIGSKLSLDNANEHFTNLLRVRNENTLIKLVKMHLLLLLDLDGENFSNVFEEENAGGSKKANTLKKKKQDYKSQEKGLFQQSLTEEGICRLYLLTDFIGRPKNINQEGIFRKCGSTARQQELKYRLQNNIDLQLETGKYTVHDCTNVLKTCLSEMPEPLLTDLFFKIITQKLAARELPNGITKSFSELDFEKIFGDKNLKIIQLILLLIPLKRRKFANDLLTLLNKIASKENVNNRMNAKSLATLFAPHLLCPKSMSPADLQRYCTILTIQLEFMIANVRQIFKTPTELTLDIRKELERMDNPNSTEDDDGLNTMVTFCDRGQAAKVANQTEQHIAELYAHIQSMPETPAKKRLIKQFNRQNGGLTPLVDKENSKKKSNKLKTIGDKLKNAKNLFKVTNSAAKSKREADDESMEQTDGLMVNHNFANHQPGNDHGSGHPGGYLPNQRKMMAGDQRVAGKYASGQMPNVETNVALFHSQPLSPVRGGNQHKETPLADLTVTKFCLDDEDDGADLMYHKKLNQPTDEIFLDYPCADYPYTSESILL